MRTIAAGGGGGCTTAEDAQTGTTENVTTDSFKYFATRFTATDTYDTCKVTMRLKRTGTLTGTLQMQLWSHNAGSNQPSTLLETASMVSADIATTSGDVTKNWAALENVANTTIYWIGILHSNGGDFSGEFITPSFGARASGRLMASSDGVAWSEQDTGTCMNFTLFQ